MTPHASPGPLCRLALALALLVVVPVWIAWVQPASAGGWTDADVSLSLTLASNRHGVSRWVLREVSFCESRWTPSAIGAQGEQGLFQLAPWGLLPEFWRQGYRDPFDPYQNADFAASMFAAGEAGKWSCFHTAILGRNPPWWRE